MMDDRPLDDHELEQASRAFCKANDSDPYHLIEYDGHNPHQASRYLWEIVADEIRRADHIRVTIAAQVNKRSAR